MILLEIIIITRFKDIRVSRKRLNLSKDIIFFLNLRNKLQRILIIVLFANKIK